MKGQTRNQLHSRAFSHGQIQLNLNDLNTARDIKAGNKYFRFKERDDSLQLNTPSVNASHKNSFSSSNWNQSLTNSISQQQGFQKTGLCFKANEIHELKEIQQDKLTILRRTCANNYGDSRKMANITGNSFFNSTMIQNQDNKIPQLDYYSKNIITNQLLFKKFDTDGNKQKQIRTREQSEKRNSVIKNDENLQTNEEIENIKGFVKTLYQQDKPSKSLHKNLQLNQDENSFSILTGLTTPSSTQYGFYANTPKTRDIFVTKLNTIDFNSAKYSTMIRDSGRKINQQLRNKIYYGEEQESVSLKKNSLFTNSIYEKTIDLQNQQSQKDKDLYFIDQFQNNQDNEQYDINITPMYDINSEAQNKILTTFKKTGEIDRNINVQRIIPSLNISNKYSQSNHQSPQRPDNIFEKYQVIYSGKQNLPQKYEQEQFKNSSVQNISQSHNNAYRQFKEEHSFYVLFIFIDNLSNIKRKSNLKYKIMKIPPIYQQISQKKVNDDFEDLKQQLQHHIGLNIKYLFFFKQNGAPIFNHLNLTEVDYNNEAIFFGSQGSFSGIQNITCSNENKQNLFNVVQHLCRKVRILNQTLQNQLNKDDDNKKSITKIGDAFSKQKILTLEQISQIKNKSIVNRIAQTLTFNPYAQVKRLNQQEPSKQENKSAQIEQQYSESINNNKKMIVEAPDHFEKQPDKNQIPNLREIAKYVDSFLLNVENKMTKKEKKKFKKQKEESERYQGIEDLWNSQKQNTKVNFVNENIEKYNNKNSIMKTLQKRNRELFIQNIPKLLNKYELSRHDLHTLLNVSVQRMNYQEVFQKGIDFKTFELGVDRLSSQGEEIIKRMCNFNSFINWQSFLEILSGIQGKDLESKINIFIKVCDTDKSGNLSRLEIEELCQICLEKFIPKGDGSIISQLTEYFTKLLFTSLDVDIGEQIPLAKLKQAIIEGHPESDLLCFFCGVN